MFFHQACFDASTSERLVWSLRMPGDYASGLALKIQHKMASATTGDIRWSCRIAAVTPGDATDVDAKAFASPVEVTSTVPTTTAGKLGEVSISMTTNDSVAAGDFVIVYVARFASDAADTAAGDVEVVAVSLEYTTT